MRLVLLGTGSAFSSARNPSGCALRLKRRALLFDLGFGNFRRLTRAGIDPARVSDVFLSHLHPDHCGDVPALLFHFRYERPPRRGTLSLWGPRGTKAWLRSLRRAWRPWLDPKHYTLRVRELEGDRSARGEGWTLSCLNAPHPTPALSFRLEAEGKSFVYSGDTARHPKLAAFARNCDLFLLECTGPGPRRVPGHLNVPQALSLARDSLCRKAVFTHLSPESETRLGVLTRESRRFRAGRDSLSVLI